MPYGMSDVEYAREVQRKQAAGIPLTQSLDKAAYERGLAQLSAQSGGSGGAKASGSVSGSGVSSSGGGSTFTFTDPYGKTYTIPSLTQERVDTAKAYLQAGGDPTTMWAAPGELARNVSTVANLAQQPSKEPSKATDPWMEAILQELAQLRNQPPTVPPEIQQELEYLRRQYEALTNVPKLSWEEAQARAQAALDPLYRQQMSETLKGVERGLIQRGFFGQLPSVPISQEVAAQIENARAAAIADLAQQLTGQSEEQARWATQTALGSAEARLNAIMNALQASAQQRQQQASSALAVATLLNTIRQQQLEQERWEREFPLQEAAVTWTYQGVPTPQARLTTLLQGAIPLLEQYGRPDLADNLRTLFEQGYLW